MERLNLWLKSRSPLWVVGAGLVGTAIVGVIDYLLGPDAQVPILYVLVALLVSWLADTAHGVFVAAGAGVVSFVANLYPPVTSSEMLTASWNSAMNFGVLLAVCFLVSGVKKANAKRRQLERQVLEMSDQERRRIAQDLHDGLCQHLTATEFASQLLTDKLAHESLPEAADARQIVGFIQRAMTQAREIAHGLHPIEIGPGGLIASIDDLCASIREVYRIECEVQGNWIADLFGDTEATHVYRIVQEAVANAIKHGKPSRILIELCADDEGIILAVHDNGLGLPKQMQHTRGLGIGTMSYRASVIGANLTVRPNPRGGTTVLLSLPKDFQTRMRSNP